MTLTASWRWQMAVMAPAAAYDEIADWCKQELPGGQSTSIRSRDGNPLDLDGVLRDLLGEGSGTCLEIGCGTGVHAAQVRGLGWNPHRSRPVGWDAAARPRPPSGRWTKASWTDQGLRLGRCCPPPAA